MIRKGKLTTIIIVFDSWSRTLVVNLLQHFHFYYEKSLDVLESWNNRSVTKKKSIRWLIEGRDTCLWGFEGRPFNIELLGHFRVPTLKNWHDKDLDSSMRTFLICYGGTILIRWSLLLFLMGIISFFAFSNYYYYFARQNIIRILATKLGKIFFPISILLKSSKHSFWPIDQEILNFGKSLCLISWGLHGWMYLTCTRGKCWTISLTFLF